MFAATPSPNKCSIKEANSHLKLLHQRVEALESTVQEQAEALITKDESHQVRVNELIAEKEAAVANLKKILEENEEKVKRYENVLREKDVVLEQLTQRFSHVEDLATFTPALERLLSSLKRVTNYRSTGTKNQISRSRTRSSTKSHSSKADHKKPSHQCAVVNHQGQGHNQILTSHEQDVVVEVNSVSQAMSDLRLKRSFKINSNFSMSEDDLDNGDLT